MSILDTIYNAAYNKGRQIKETIDNIVNSPEMEYIKMAAPRTEIVNARNQLWKAWQDYINVTYPETYMGKSNEEPYFETYWLTPRWSEKSEAAAEAYNNAYDEFAPALWDEAYYGWPYARNFWPRWNIPEHLQGRKLVRVSAPSWLNPWMEIVDRYQNQWGAIAGFAPWMTFEPTPLFKEWEVKKWADIIRKMKSLGDEYRETQKQIALDRAKYEADLLATIDRYWRGEEWADKYQKYSEELRDRRRGLDNLYYQLLDLRNRYREQLKEMTQAPELVDYSKTRLNNYY